MKRLLSLFMVLFMVLAPVAVHAAGTTVELKAPTTTTKAGSTFTVSLNISGNPGICSAQFTLSFDKTLMECTSADTGTVLSGALSATNPKANDGAIIAAATTTPITKDGALATFTFKVLKDVSKYSFTLSNMILADNSGKDISYTLKGVEAASSQEEQGESGNNGGGNTGNTGGTGSGSGNTGSGTGTSTEGKTEDKTKAEEPVKQEEKVVEHIFPDTNGHWAEEYINKASKMGIFGGYGNGNFGPNDNITRAQFVTVLWRMAGKPASSKTTPFVDTGSQLDEFKKAIAWAYEKGLINGSDPTHFNPDGQLKRQEAIKILFYYNGGQSSGEAMWKQVYDKQYSDMKDVADWAKSAVYWSIYNEVISGTTTSTLSPTVAINRASIAKVLVCYAEKNGAQ